MAEYLEGKDRINRSFLICLLYNDSMLGVDIEDISRFENKKDDKKFLNRIYTQSELDYCFSYKHYASHLCARFCVKEAVIKVLSYLGVKLLEMNKIEVYHGSNKEPYVRILDDRFSDIKIDISISHDKTKAIAVAMIDNLSVRRYVYKPCCTGDDG